MLKAASKSLRDTKVKVCGVIRDLIDLLNAILDLSKEKKLNHPVPKIVMAEEFGFRETPESIELKNTY
jgi:hypothetical protein